MKDKDSEPEFPNFFVDAAIIAGHREDVQSASTVFWESMSGQSVDFDKLPYFMVRFNFSNGNTNAQFTVMDEHGNPLPQNLPSLLEEDHGSNGDDDYDGDEEGEEDENEMEIIEEGEGGDHYGNYENVINYKRRGDGEVHYVKEEYQRLRPFYARSRNFVKDLLQNKRPGKVRGVYGVEYEKDVVQKMTVDLNLLSKTLKGTLADHGIQSFTNLDYNHPFDPREIEDEFRIQGYKREYRGGNIATFVRQSEEHTRGQYNFNGSKVLKDESSRGKRKKPSSTKK
ncbi:hypothetical protein ABW21_db0209877 [Orbilia brochopaga]|nr:hypothetical protein ABW21_db0209877 [Drechslerella brochopaga]